MTLTTSTHIPTATDSRPTATSRVELDGVSLAYSDTGGSTIPLLMVHGVGSSTATWGSLPAELAAAGQRVICVDLIGHGESRGGNGDFSLGANASTLRDLLDALGIQQVHIVGHSFGGGVSMQFSYQFPERVRSVVLISSGGLGTDVHFGLRAASLPGSEWVLRQAVHPRVLRLLDLGAEALGTVGLRHRGVSSHTVTKMRQLQDAYRLGGFVSTVRSVVGPEGQRVQALDKLQRLQGERVTIMWGDADAMVPMEHGQRAHELLPGSRFVQVVDAGHHPHDDAPDRVMLELLRHIKVVDALDHSSA
ncbi:MAG: alpha/beta hydrolase [Candidatus Nanopelagicales bacterium]|nr:alpha/beta hydrolase [Candidatus Nanopelagicales bacterium]MDP4824489.1 alpha/beta hydrolase [Candidatus Nanopelagicales bacterium]